MERVSVAGVSISHPDRLIYRELAISKLQLAKYFEAIADWIVPHVAGRPLTLLHCPSGVAGPCSFLRHAKAWGPTALRRLRIQEKTKVGEYLVADDISGVVALAQMGIVEIHTWNSTTSALEQPDRLIWDLDPGPKVAWSDVVDVARLLGRVLETLGLSSWVKTTGGSGLHVVVPVVPSRPWGECLDFARRLSEAIVRSDPDRCTTTFSKRGREDKILIDYLRNNRTNTSIAAFSPRARGDAPVSLPIDWRELGRRREPIGLPRVLARLRRLRADPWAGYFRARQRISDRALAALDRLV
jgi:bifunctional non-homologous end joining protein LigD